MGTTGVQPGRALIVGLGISGMSTAIRLHGLGWKPTIVERNPGRRTEGYFIATMGTGQAAARRLGILDALPNRISPPGSTQYQVTRDSARKKSVGVFDIPLRPKPMLMLRGDVEEALFNALPADVTVRTRTTPVKIVQDADGIEVTLRELGTETETTEQFDLMVGADGLRSTVRQLVFGPHEKYLHPLGFMIAAFQLPRVPTGLGPSDGAMQFEVGRSLIIYPFADHLPTALFSYKTDDVDAEFTQAPAERLREVYGPAPYGQLFEEVVADFAKADSYLFDSAEQVTMDTWHKGRVVLVGDSAWCPTLYSGMGSSTGMAGADLLGAVLEENPVSLEAALTDWERRLRPYTDSYQKMGATGALAFTPPNERAIILRKLIQSQLRRPWLAPVIQLAAKVVPLIRDRNVDLVAATEPVPA